MNNVQWSQQDFDVFTIPGLAERMESLQTIVRPKFQLLGDIYSNYFSVRTEDEFFPHVAKHARRTVNPPNDSWVAFAPYKRGYKSLPHFQIGLWNTHLFIIVAIIYEAPQKTVMANRLLENLDAFNQLSDHFIISGDHMSQDAISLKLGREEILEQLLTRLRDVKKDEFLVGRHIPREEAVNLSSDEFLSLTEETFDALMPIYNIITGRSHLLNI